jgi:hypothetical protein
MTRALAIVNRLRGSRLKDGQPPPKPRCSIDGKRLAEYLASQAVAREKASLKKQKVRKRFTNREKAAILLAQHDLKHT